MTAAPKRHANVWTREHDRKLLALIAQCGPNLCRTIIAVELRLGNYGTFKIRKRLRELNIKGTAL